MYNSLQEVQMQSTLEQFNDTPPSWALACPMSDSAMDRLECLFVFRRIATASFLLNVFVRFKNECGQQDVTARMIVVASHACP